MTKLLALRVNGTVGFCTMLLLA